MKNDSKSINDKLANMPNFMKKKEVMQYLDCSESKLINLRKSGKLTARFIGRQCYFLSSDVAALFQN